MYIAVGQTSHRPDDIPKSQASNLWHHRFSPLVPNKGRGQNALSSFEKTRHAYTLVA